MYLGRFVSGDTVHLTLRSSTPNGAAATLTSTPICRVYDNATLEDTYTLYLNDNDRTSFIYDLLIPSALSDTSRKVYSLLYTWETGGDTYNSFDTVVVMPTITDDGSVIGVFNVTRDGGQWVLMHIEDKGLVLGYNPSGD